MINKREYDQLITLIQDILRFDLPHNDLRTLNISPNIWEGIDIVLGEKQLTIAQAEFLPKGVIPFFHVSYLEKPYDVIAYLEGKKPVIEKQRFYSYSKKLKAWIDHSPGLKKLREANTVQHNFKNIAEEWASILIYGVRTKSYNDIL